MLGITIRIYESCCVHYNTVSVAIKMVPTLLAQVVRVVYEKLPMVRNFCDTALEIMLLGLNTDADNDS